MSNNTQDFPILKGVRIFPRNANAPDFVQGDITINVDALIEFLKSEGQKFIISDPRYGNQIHAQLLSNSKGLYISINKYKTEKMKEAIASGRISANKETAPHIPQEQPKYVPPSEQAAQPSFRSRSESEDDDLPF